MAQNMIKHFFCFSQKTPRYTSPGFSANSRRYRQLAMARASKDLIAIAAVTATASLSSMIGSAFILVCYAILPSDRHFRHILILNLAASGKLHQCMLVSMISLSKRFIDFVHSLNNAIADLYLLSHKRILEPSLACTLNGFVEQVTNQVNSMYQVGRITLTRSKGY